MKSLYREHILDHYKFPRNRGRIDECDLHSKSENISCGDEVELFIKLSDDKKVEEIKFEARGCAISIATMSMLSEMIKGKTIEELNEMSLESVLGLTGLDQQSGRMKCGKIAWDALQKAIHKG